MLSTECFSVRVTMQSRCSGTVISVALLIVGRIETMAAEHRACLKIL